MTRQELEEDVNVGDTVKITTKSGEFTGRAEKKTGMPSSDFLVPHQIGLNLSGGFFIWYFFRCFCFGGIL